MLRQTADFSNLFTPFAFHGATRKNGLKKPCRKNPFFLHVPRRCHAKPRQGIISGLPLHKSNTIHDSCLNLFQYLQLRGQASGARGDITCAVQSSDGIRDTTKWRSSYSRISSRMSILT